MRHLRGLAKHALGAALAALWLQVVLSPARAGAAPRVEVRAAAAIEIQSVEPAGESSMRIIGQVRDTYSGQPIANVMVRGLIDGVAFLERTDQQGRFVAIAPSPLPPQRIEATLDSARFIEATPLAVTAPAVNRPMPLLRLAASVAGAALQLELGLELTEPDGATSLRSFELPVAISAAQGDSVVTLSDAFIHTGQFDLVRLPTPGPWTIRAAFPGSNQWAPTDATAIVEVTGTAALSLRLAAATVHADRYIEATGQLTRDDGGTVPTFGVVLMAGKTRLATTVSDASGKFAFSVPGNVLPVGRHALTVALDTPLEHIAVAPSPLQWLVIAGVSAQTQMGLVVGVLCTAFAVMSVIWLQRRWRRRQRPKAAPPARKPGFAPAPPSLARRLLRSPQRRVRLRIFDAASGRPLAADVTARAPSGIATTFSAPTGKLDVSLPDGAYILEVGTPAHQAVTQSLSLPHFGEWSNRDVYLISTRDHLFELYAAAVAPFVQLSPNIQSPARVVAHVRQSLVEQPALAGHAYAHIEELTARIEQVYFTNLAVQAADVAAIGQLTTALSRGLR